MLASCNWIVIIFLIFSFFILIEKYDYVGRLLKPGEEPTNYSDEEEEPSQTEEEKKKITGSGDKLKDE